MYKTVDACLGGMMFILIILVMMWGGCSQPAQNFRRGPKEITHKTPDRCKTLGKIVGNHSVVLVQKDCLKNGVTTVIIGVFTTNDGGKAAASEATTNMLKILGFTPTLSLLTIVPWKNNPYYIFVVTGISGE